MPKWLMLMCVVIMPNAVIADEWTPEVKVQLVEPLLSWQGGMVRVKVDTAVTTSLCGTATVFDLLFAGGTQEIRSAMVSALYMALAANKPVAFYVSTASCSPAGAPVITGLNVVS